MGSADPSPSCPSASPGQGADEAACFRAAVLNRMRLLRCQPPPDP